jgi:hypothetical protein
MSRKKRRCDTRSPPPFETPPPISREEHEQNWHTCCTFDLDTLECNICMDYLVAPICQVNFPIVPPFGRRLLEKTHHSEKRPKLLRFYYRADNVPIYSPVKPIDLEM